MSLYLGENLISGVTTTVDKSERIGQIIQSTIPLTDAGLHLLDGALINGSGIYSDFVDYIADLYNEMPSLPNAIQHGTLTNNNGVISGFSQSNYATVPFNVSLGSSFELQIKCKTSSLNSPTYLNILSGDTNQYLALSITNSNILNFNIGNGSSWLNPTVTDDSVSANTDYWFKIVFNGSKYSLLKSTDGTTYTEIAYLNSTTVIPTFSMRFGVSRSSDSPFNGSIDLNECYININGSRVWDGIGKPCFCTEAEWQASVTQYGVCGKFVYDSVNNTVRLPKITGIIEGTTDVSVLGDLVEAGLPNITGTWNSESGAVGPVTTNINSNSGAFTTGNSHSWSVQSRNVTGYDLVIDASRSSSIYGNSSTVQPQTIKAFYYIVVATSTKTDIQVDIDEIATDLNGKADTDLSNLSNGLTNTICTTSPTTTSSATSARPAVVKENYVNGTSWYRVYSDGWCEQGGNINPTDAQAIDLLKPYKDTNYSVLAVNCYKDATNRRWASAGINSASQIWVMASMSYTQGSTTLCRWQASGYIR